MSGTPKLVTVEKDQTTLAELDAKKFVIFKTREIAGFLKYIHDTNDLNKMKQMIADFLTDLAENIKQ